MSLFKHINPLPMDDGRPRCLKCGKWRPPRAFGMPGFQPCGPCCVQRECSICDDVDGVPASWSVVVSGIVVSTNGLNSTDCVDADFNGTYILDYTGPCTWNLPISDLCTMDTDCDGDGSRQVTVNASLSFSFVAGDVMTFVLVWGFGENTVWRTSLIGSDKCNQEYTLAVLSDLDCVADSTGAASVVCTPL